MNDSDARRVTRSAHPVSLFGRTLWTPKYETTFVTLSRLGCVAIEGTSLFVIGYLFFILVFSV